MIFFEKSFEFVFLLLYFNYLTRTRFEFILNLSQIISFSNFLLTWWLLSYFRITCSMHTQANINVVSNNKSNKFWMCFNWINLKFVSFQKINISVCVINYAQNRVLRKFIFYYVSRYQIMSMFHVKVCWIFINLTITTARKDSRCRKQIDSSSTIVNIASRFSIHLEFNYIASSRNFILLKWRAIVNRWWSRTIIILINEQSFIFYSNNDWNIRRVFSRFDKCNTWI